MHMTNILEDQRSISKKDSMERIEDSFEGDGTSEDHPDRKKEFTLKATGVTKRSPYKAFCLALFSGVTYSVVSMLGKQSSNINFSQLSAYFSLGIFVFTLPITSYRNESFRFTKSKWILLILRGIASASISILSFLSFRFLPLGDASVIIYSTPVFVTIFARIFFKEKCTKIDVVAVVLTIIGLALASKLPQAIAEPTNRLTTDYLIGIFSALGALLSYSTFVLITRKLKGLHYSVVAIVTAFVALVVGIGCAGFVDKFSNPCGQEYVALFFAVMAFITQISMIKAIQLDHAGPVSTTRSAGDIIFAVLWQVLFFREPTDGYSLSGAVVITFCIIIIGLKNWIFTLPEESAVKRKTLFLFK